MLLTPNVPAPPQQIIHPKTWAVYRNMASEVYERAKALDLDRYGYTILTSQHDQFMQPNEDGEFARIGFFKKIEDGFFNKK